MIQQPDLLDDGTPNAADAGEAARLADGIPPDWREAVAPYLATAEWARLAAFLAAAARDGKRVYPPAERRFAALAATPLAAVRAVILGQDPYHGAGQAHGLAFSVPPGVRPPPSLRNILVELAADLGVSRPKGGCLQAWAERGVLLLNGVLSVEHGLAASHARKGWEGFTRHVLRAVDAKPDPVAFVAWGAPAQKMLAFVDRGRHAVIESAHPSPLSAHRGFLGSRPFSAVNRFLAKRGRPEIDWTLG